MNKLVPFDDFILSIYFMCYVPVVLFQVYFQYGILYGFFRAFFMLYLLYFLNCSLYGSIGQRFFLSQYYFFMKNTLNNAW